MKRNLLKILAVLGCLALSAGFAACGGKDDGGNSSGSDSLDEISSFFEENSSEVVADSSSEVFSSEDNSSEEVSSEVGSSSEEISNEDSLEVVDSSSEEDSIEVESSFEEISSEESSEVVEDSSSEEVVDSSSEVVSSSGEDKIAFKTLSVNGTNVYGKVNNTTETFSFINEITTGGTTKYTVSLDIYGIQQVASKTIPLSIGDNLVYIIETVDDEPINVYTVTVRRRPTYEVNFNTNGGSAVEKQTIEEDGFVSEPNTTKTGYTFTAWDYDFAKPITNNTEIAASWTANTNTPYKVEYYLQNLENDEYTLETTENKTGTTDTTVNAEIKSFTHFTYKASATDSGNISGDGSTVLKVYYTRNEYTVTFYGNGGTLSSGNTIQIVKYQGDAIAPAFIKNGYDLSWDKAFTNISKDTIINADWQVITYSVTFDNLKGVINPNASITTYTIESGTTTLKNPTVEPDGYDFSHWVMNGEVITEISIGEYGNKSITAVWNAIFNVDNGSVTLTSYGRANYTEIIIPESIDGVAITSINNKAFYDCSSLTSVVIPDSVTSIGRCAFQNCYSLTSVVISDSVEIIGNQAFCNCKCLSSVVIGDGVTTIGDYAFNDTGYYNKGNNWENDVLYIGKYLIEARDSIIGDYTIKRDTLCIADFAFHGCSQLTNIQIPDSVTSIGMGAFDGCSSLMSIAIPDGVTSIGYFTFACCSSLKTINIPDSVTSISYLAFDGCNSLTEIVIPNSVTSIGNNAFSFCYNLTEIVIPDSVTSIDYFAFDNCDNLTIYCETESKPSGWNDGWNPDNRPVVWGYKGE